jgi:GR25 family glycosyltransferase involved in LPS biosynthesis
MQVPDEKIVRISAVNKPGQGDWGCSLSHVVTMSQFIDSGLDNCIVFEDDFVFTQDLQTLNTTFRDVLESVQNYDVIMLSGNVVESKSTEHNHIEKVLDAQTTSGYMVNRHFAPVLLQNYRNGAKLIEQSYKIGKSDALQGPFCIDQYWKRLQPQSNWFIFSPKMGLQRESHSDIQGGVINPGV